MALIDMIVAACCFHYFTPRFADNLAPGFVLYAKMPFNHSPEFITTEGRWKILEIRLSPKILLCDI